MNRPRIRTVKPELFLHEQLFAAERESALPLRLAFIGLLCHCDREGRFEWRPLPLGTQVLPYDNIDFARVLDALTTRGFVERYECNGKQFGWVPGFLRHQVINNRESSSTLPEPPSAAHLSSNSTRQQHVPDASATRHDLSKAEWEREWERERELTSAGAGAGNADAGAFSEKPAAADWASRSAEYAWNTLDWKVVLLKCDVLYRRWRPNGGKLQPNDRSLLVKAVALAEAGIIPADWHTDAIAYTKNKSNPFRAYNAKMKPRCNDAGANWLQILKGVPDRYVQAQKAAEEAA
ncbi:MAG TPA: hypothetical protein VFE46_07825 [Pirellulales bacterium]|jgi:hypothetical protein|nr:hypothetical protein [Pirellulales bacterium]